MFNGYPSFSALLLPGAAQLDEKGESVFVPAQDCLKTNLVFIQRKINLFNIVKYR